MEENWISILALLIGAVSLVVTIVASRDKLLNFRYLDELAYMFGIGVFLLCLAISANVLLMYDGLGAIVGAAVFALGGIWFLWFSYTIWRDM